MRIFLLFIIIHALYNFILPFLSSKIKLSNKKIALFNLILLNRFFKYDLFNNMHYGFLNMQEMTHVIFLKTLNHLPPGTITP